MTDSYYVHDKIQFKDYVMDSRIVKYVLILCISIYYSPCEMCHLLLTVRTKVYIVSDD